MNTILDRIVFAAREGHSFNHHDVLELIKQYTILLGAVRHAIPALNEVAVTVNQCAAIRSLKDAIKECDGGAA